MARIVLLVVVLGLSACAAVPDTFACDHCACASTARAVRRPVMCATIGREASCCPLFLGS